MRHSSPCSGLCSMCEMWSRQALELARHPLQHEGCGRQRVHRTSSSAQGFQQGLSLPSRISDLSRLRLTCVQCAAGPCGLVGSRLKG